MEAEVYVGATKEDQARICWKQAAQFVQSPAANPLLKQLGFEVLQKTIKFKNLALVIIDEQHHFGVEQRSVLIQSTG